MAAAHPTVAQLRTIVQRIRHTEEPNTLTALFQNLSELAQASPLDILTDALSSTISHLVAVCEKHANIDDVAIASIQFFSTCIQRTSATKVDYSGVIALIMRRRTFSNLDDPTLGDTIALCSDLCLSQPDTAVLLWRNDVVSQLVHVVHQAASRDAAMVYSACVLLEHICKHSTEAAAEFCRKDGAFILIELFRMYPDSSQLVSPLFNLLAAIAPAPMAANTATAAATQNTTPAVFADVLASPMWRHGLLHIMAAAWTCIGDNHAVHNAFDALFRLARASGMLAVELQRINALDFIARAMLMHVGTSDTVLNGLLAVKKIKQGCVEFTSPALTFTLCNTIAYVKHEHTDDGALNDVASTVMLMLLPSMVSPNVSECAMPTNSGTTEELHTHALIPVVWELIVTDTTTIPVVRGCIAAILWALRCDRSATISRVPHDYFCSELAVIARGHSSQDQQYSDTIANILAIIELLPADFPGAQAARLDCQNISISHPPTAPHSGSNNSSSNSSWVPWFAAVAVVCVAVYAVATTFTGKRPEPETLEPTVATYFEALTSDVGYTPVTSSSAAQHTLRSVAAGSGTMSRRSTAAADLTDAMETTARFLLDTRDTDRQQRR